MPLSSEARPSTTRLLTPSTTPVEAYFSFKSNAVVKQGCRLNPLESFLAGAPDPKQGGRILEGSANRTFSQWNFSGFFEDSWRATKKLTVNMGLRYEYYTPLSEINNLIGSFSPQVGFEQQGVNISHPYNPDYKDVSPRLGIANDLTGKGTTVGIRAGFFGFYYTEIIDLQLVGDTSLPGSNPGISSIPTAFATVLPNGTVQPPLNPTNGIGSTAVSIPGSNLDWNLAPVPVLPASVSKRVCLRKRVTAGSRTSQEPGNLVQRPLHHPHNLPSPRVTSWNLGIQHAF